MEITHKNDNFKMNGNWETQSNQLKKDYIQLTDADLKFESGKEEELLTRIETRLKKHREEVISIITKNRTEKSDAGRKPSRSL